MARSESSQSEAEVKRLTAEEVYELVREVLGEHFQLDMDNSRYEEQDIWDVLVAAAVEQVTIEMACDMLEGAPSPNTVRNAVHQMLGDEDKLAELEERINAMLVARLPKKLLKRARPCAVDFTEIPYHGQHEEEDEGVRRGKAKSGTTHFHCYATLCIVKDNKRYTLAITLVRRSDLALDALRRLLTRGTELGLRIRRLLLDRGFDNNDVIAYLVKQAFPTIMPLTIRGKTGGSRALLKGNKSYKTIYTRSSAKYGEQTFPVHVVRKYSKGRYKRYGVYYLAYIVIGKLKMLPHQVFEEYRLRFGIETSYRLMNTMRARTTSTSVALRLFYVALALLLLNLWTFTKWQHLYIPKPGPRQVLHDYLPLFRWRLWLWEMVKQRLGFSLVIIVPLAA